MFGKEVGARALTFRGPVRILRSMRPRSSCACHMCCVRATLQVRVDVRFLSLPSCVSEIQSYVNRIRFALGARPSESLIEVI